MVNVRIVTQGTGLPLMVSVMLDIVKILIVKYLGVHQDVNNVLKDTIQALMANVR